MRSAVSWTCARANSRVGGAGCRHFDRKLPKLYPANSPHSDEASRTAVSSTAATATQFPPAGTRRAGGRGASSRHIRASQTRLCGPTIGENPGRELLVFSRFILSTEAADHTVGGLFMLAAHRRSRFQMVASATISNMQMIVRPIRFKSTAEDRLSCGQLCHKFWWKPA